MNGLDGNNGADWAGVYADNGTGEKRGDAGNIFICCERMVVPMGQDLRLSANGAPGEPGQPGQGGAEGGDGGRGSDGVQYPGLGASYSSPTNGGAGGDGGRGGRGGDGGKGGKGGTVVVHCIAGPPPINCSVEGGTSQPGQGGRGGDGGAGKPGGRGLTVRRPPPHRGLITVPNATDGVSGNRGLDGKSGDAHPGDPGTQKVTTGDVPKEALASLAQLQMVFEAARGDYLVTPVPDYRLQMLVVPKISDLPTVGDRNLFLLALVGSQLHIKIFDATGSQAVHWHSDGASPDEGVVHALKRRFAVMPGVLLVGDWTQSQVSSLSADDRSELVQQLGNLTGQAGYFGKLTDNDLIGKAAVAAFLLAAGIRGSAWFKTEKNVENHRNTLITENGKHTGRGSELQGMTNQQLIGVGLTWFNWSKRLSDMLSGADRQAIIQQICNLVGYRDGWIDIGERLAWVASLVCQLVNRGSDEDAKQLAASLVLSVCLPMERFTRGLDYLGKGPSFAPGLTFKSCDEALNESLSCLFSIEASHAKYFADLQSQLDIANNLGLALDNYKKQSSFVSNRASRIRDELLSTEMEIQVLDDATADKKEALKESLRTFEDKVKAAFGLGLDTLFNCLSQLSFVNLGEPVRALETISKVGGVAGAGAMAVGQIGAMVNEAANNVINDYGEPVKKQLLLKQVKVIEGDLDLRSQFERLSIDYISTDQSHRLVVQLEKFKELCDQFERSLDDKSMLATLQSFIDAITKRNRKIDDYNALFHRRTELLGEESRLEQQQAAVEGRQAEADPGLPAMASFVSGLYERAKAEAVADFFMTYRAFAFWALVPPDGFYDHIGRNPQGINADQLKGAQLSLHQSLRESVEKGQNPPVYFPEDDSGFGRVVVLTREVHKELFEDLEFGSADFEILPATADSPAPASDFEPTRTVVRVSDKLPTDAETLPNPFYGMANVRLRKVRAWMVGMNTGGKRHHVELVHMGEERFRTPDDRPYPDPRDGAGSTNPAYIRHGPRAITFAYNSTSLAFDAATMTLTPGSLQGSIAGLQDGELGLHIDRGNALPLKCEFAPIGPFGKWQLMIPPKYNGDDKLSFKDLTMIVIDFHGICQHFS
jgi:hypothetical protein